MPTILEVPQSGIVLRMARSYRLAIPREFRRKLNISYPSNFLMSAVKDGDSYALVFRFIGEDAWVPDELIRRGETE